MLFNIIGVIFIVTAVDVAHARYQYRPKINGWINVHRVSSIWADAVRQCMEEGAILASPINEDLTYELQILFENTPFYIGANARLNPNIYMSVEGVHIDDMPLMGMYDSLNSNDGLCLSMNNHSVRAVSCESRLPYVCYKQREEDVEITECGTFDKEYKFEESTGSCYKYHYQLKTWSDAYSICVAEGGYLVVINNEQEANVIINNLNDTSHYIITGVRDWMDKGSWISVRGEPVEKLYNVWEDGEKPTNSAFMSAELHPTTGKLKQFPYHDTSFFICEKDPSNILLTSGEQ